MDSEEDRKMQKYIEKRAEKSMAILGSSLSRYKELLSNMHSLQMDLDLTKLSPDNFKKYSPKGVQKRMEKAGQYERHMIVKDAIDFYLKQFN